jgi:arylformamidase
MITDFDDAYSNMAHIPGGAEYPARWAAAARLFREHLPPGCTAQFDIPYGAEQQQSFDFYMPPHLPKGLVVFVHGGYWMRFGKNDWSHLANGALARGWAVAMPGYRLTPEVRIAGCVADTALAVTRAATRVAGPIRLAGHSAGGHLVIRQICNDTALPGDVCDRVQHIVSISGLFDLRPLLRTQMNATLHLTEAEAVRQSPALQQPIEGVPITCWVGSDERPEFLRQNDLLANIWTGLGANINQHHAASKHHFNVIDDLSDPESELTKRLAP